ncbi:MAG: hypothetical protein ABI717_07450 [Actinomycetota bacterium]
MVGRACLVPAVLGLAACSFGDEQASQQAQLASGMTLPAGCAKQSVRADATASFVAEGRAWALDPATGRVTCLFPVRNAGPFAWGPRGDRALLAHLEVKGLGNAPSRPPGRVEPTASSWGRPIGKSIVFVGKGGRALLKAHPAGGGFTDVTPVKGAIYERVVYHPSGLAFAFVLRRGGRASIWISSNVGKTPRQFVHGRLHTGFDAITFADGGMQLYFAARHVDRRVDVHRLQLVGATSAPVVWRGEPEERVTDLVAAPGGPDLAFTAGRSCESRHAVVVTARHSKGAELIPDERRSRAVGWLDPRHVLVAAGGCGSKLDLYSVAAASLEARLLVRGVDAASVRRAEQLPPPLLSPEVLGAARSSFA